MHRPYSTVPINSPRSRPLLFLHPSAFILHPSSLKQKARRSRAFLFRSDSRSGADPYQASGAFDRAGAVRPLDVSLITHYGLDHTVRAFKQTERTQKIHPRTHRNLWTTRIEHATEG